MDSPTVENKDLYKALEHAVKRIDVLERDVKFLLAHSKRVEDWLEKGLELFELNGYEEECWD